MYLTITVDGKAALDGFPLKVVRGVTALKGMVESLTSGAVSVDATLRDDGEDVLRIMAQHPDPRALALLVAGYFPKKGAK